LPGDYRVEVSGTGIETAESGIIHIEDGKVFLSELVAVRRTEGSGKVNGAAGSVVKVEDLNVPKKAADELARGNSEMQHKNWEKAADHFKKAVSIDPQYCSAYYNLSVAYFQLKQTDKQRDALQKALNGDNHFVPALVGLAHIDFADHKLPETRDLLNKAVSDDPTDVDALALLVRVDFMQGKYQEAIADVQKVHELPHAGYATVHYTAAAAYQRLNKIPEMIEELKIYLKEDPASPTAGYVRKTIADLQSQPQ
jgi:tetratricopeptide (TPR) repeat protein